MDTVIGNFKFIETSIADVFIVEPKKYGDNRGYFMETYKKLILMLLVLSITLYRTISPSQKQVF